MTVAFYVYGAHRPKQKRSESVIKIKKRLTVDASALIDQSVADLAVVAAREVISSIAQGSRMAMLALSTAMLFDENQGPTRENKNRE